MINKNLPAEFLLYILKKFFSIPENKNRSLGNPKKILVIRQHNQFGDLLAGVSLFRAIKETYPETHLTVITSIENYYGAVKNKFIDELYVFNKSLMFNPLKLFSFLKFLRNPYDVVIVPVTVSISFTSNLMARLSNSKIRIGPNSLDGNPNKTAFLFDKRIDIDWRKYPDSNVAEHILEIVKPFGIQTKDFSSEISFDSNDLEQAKKFLHSIEHNHEKKLIGLHVGAGKPPNRWSLKKFSELINELSNLYSATIYLTGTTADKEEVEYVFTNTKSKPFKFLNKTVPVVAALISLSDLFISNDTGIMHVAGSTNTPLISLFGPTNPFNWAPCGKNKYFIRKSELIDDIEVYDVLDLCKKILSKDEQS